MTPNSADSLTDSSSPKATIRRHLADKTGGKLVGKHRRRRLIRVIGGPGLTAFIRFGFIVVGSIALRWFLSDDDTGQVSPVFDILFGLAGIFLCLRVVSTWIQKTLFSNQTRFYLAIPSDPFREVIIRQLKAFALNFLLSGVALFIVFSVWHHRATGQFTGIRPLTAAVITWLNFVGISGLISPLFVRWRPTLKLPQQLWSVVWIGWMLLVVFGDGWGSTALGFVNVLMAKVYPGVFEWLPPFWGMLWWNDEFEAIPAAAVLPATIVVALAGGYGFYRAVWKLREIFQTSEHAMLSPHFSHGENNSPEPEPSSNEETPPPRLPPLTAAVAAKPTFARWKFIERILSAWVTVEENRARSLALGPRWPELTIRWLKGCAWIFAGCVIVGLVSLADQRFNFDLEWDNNLYGISVIAVVACLGMCAIKGLNLLLSGLGTSRIFSTFYHGISGILKPIAYPVRLRDLMALEVKATVIFVAASVIPLHLAGTFISSLFEWNPGRTLLLITVVQLMVLASIPMFHNTVGRNCKGPSILNIWFWLRVIGSLCAVLVTLAGIIFAVVSTYLDRYNGFSVFVPLVVAAANYANWYFISRPSYDVAAFDLVARNYMEYE